MNIVEPINHQVSKVFDTTIVGGDAESQIKLTKFVVAFDWHGLRIMPEQSAITSDRDRPYRPGRCPKIPVPPRTCVAPKAIAIS